LHGKVSFFFLFLFFEPPPPLPSVSRIFFGSASIQIFFPIANRFSFESLAFSFFLFEILDRMSYFVFMKPGIVPPLLLPLFLFSRIASGLFLLWPWLLHEIVGQQLPLFPHHRGLAAGQVT